MILEGKRNYLKADEVRTGDKIKILSEGEWIESTKWKYPDGNPKRNFVVKVEICGIERDMTLNSTNRSQLITAWGNDTVEWINREATVEIVKMNVNGQLKNCIVLTG